MFVLRKKSSVLSVGPVLVRGVRQSINLNEAARQSEKKQKEEKDAARESRSPSNSTADEELSEEMRQQLILLAKEILQDWAFHVKNIEVIQGGQMALVWKVETDGGPVCLKRIHRPEKKALYSIYAQHWLSEKGARVAEIIPTADGKMYVKHDPFLFVVYEWIEGRPPELQNDDDLKKVMAALAEYHEKSKGFTAPAGIEGPNKLGQWPYHYRKRLQQLTSWKQIAKRQPENPFSREYQEKIDSFLSSGEAILKELRASSYNEWVERCKKEPVLCHQDFGAGNTLIRNDEVWIIDLDTTAVDLPIRDLRKMIIPEMENEPEWNDKRFSMMLESYESVSPLSVEEKRVMYIDMKFHYELYECCREHFALHQEPGLAALKQVEAFEQRKEKALNSRIAQLS